MQRTISSLIVVTLVGCGAVAEPQSNKTEIAPAEVSAKASAPQDTLAPVRAAANTPAQGASVPPDSGTPAPDEPCLAPLPEDDWSAGEEVLFFDFTKNLTPDPKVGSFQAGLSPLGTAPVRMPDTEQSALLGKLFSSYLLSRQACESYFTDAKEAQAEGQFAPRVDAYMEGSFTKAKQKEKAYLINLHECGMTTFTAFPPTNMLVVFSEDGRLVAKFDGLWSTDIEGRYDLNRDGVHELLLGSFNVATGGYTFMSAQLVSLQGGKHLTTEKDFALVWEAGCGSGQSEARVWGQKIYVKPLYTPAGFRPIFRFEKDAVACPKQ